jgi:Protein of unknown function (DUF2735)
MATHIHRGPSNVIEFRAARRVIVGGIRDAVRSQKPDGEVKPDRLSKTDFGDCWYHEAAIREDDADRKQ